MNRRSYVAALGTAATAGLAGCSGSDYDAVAADAGDARDWPMPGHDAANTRYIPEGTAPRSGVETVWRTEVLMPTGPPSVAEDTVFLPVGNDVLAVDAASGEIRWRADPDENAAVYWSAPTVLDGVAYLVGDDALRALAVDDGTEQWRYEFDDPTGYLAPTPGFGGDELFVAAGETVYRFDTDTGDLEWERDVFGQVRQTLAYRPGMVFAVTEGGDVYALADGDGGGYWRTALPDMVQCPPTFADGRLYVGCFDGNLYALNERGAIEWSTDIGGFAKGGIGAAHDTVYADGGRSLHALDAETGNKQWAVSLGTTGDHPPVIVDDTVYTGGAKLRALKLGGGLGVGGTRIEPARFTADLGEYVGQLVAADGSLYAAVEVKRDPNGGTDSDNRKTELQRLDAQSSG
ncbi:PQQ-binding-like beta-propeller repeat protein [Halorarius litoreus]|uniref:PQQ-binding-like beta-propeller repeat protein n=1 Tax=Halorarius litoreus TaxID=2962676 RepID=UPI0020CC733E|nr:PQQ-binding-like beta-propeller repeat protein [Halorarius litoreus]